MEWFKKDLKTTTHMTQLIWPSTPAGYPTCLFEIVVAVLVAVGDMQGVKMFQRASFVWKTHGGYALQDLIQFLLAGGLEKAKKAEREIRNSRLQPKQRIG